MLYLVSSPRIQGGSSILHVRSLFSFTHFRFHPLQGAFARAGGISRFAKATGATDSEARLADAFTESARKQCRQPPFQLNPLSAITPGQFRKYFAFVL